MPSYNVHACISLFTPLTTPRPIGLVHYQIFVAIYESIQDGRQVLQLSDK